MPVSIWRQIKRCAGYVPDTGVAGEVNELRSARVEGVVRWRCLRTRPAKNRRFRMHAGDERAEEFSLACGSGERLQVLGRKWCADDARPGDVRRIGWRSLQNPERRDRRCDGNRESLEQERAALILE